MSIQDATGQFALDVQGLERLKHTARQDSAAGLRGAAQQFEALFLQMMLKSMRDTIPDGGLLDSQQGEFYQSMLDQQWAQTMAGRGIGLADHLVAQLEGQLGASSSRSGVADRELGELIAGIPRGTPRVLQDALQPAGEEAIAPQDEGKATGAAREERAASLPATFLEELEAVRGGFMSALDATLPAPSRAAGEPGSAGTAAGEALRSAPSDGQGGEHVQRFMQRLSAPAQAASRQTGVPAELILAQAALETGWGRHEIATADGGNSYNLFGIKAGRNWQGRTTDVTTHEYINGRRTRVVDTFRAYDSFEQAFTDYARLIGNNPRYAAVTTAGSAEQAARALQAGGYATDPAYADKLIAVMNSMGPVQQRGDSLVFFSY
ncbi:flagellar assembly peptidoglycan hydrolase FlgJ [Halomonas sp. MCCC 1A17488]|uniref:Peptidoglycan hydrolase FlgJ n=1 Tax=Billgrantia sulfidoxydans TaxID=2733484 RepID=A0ABX7W4T5_9GAMM|nr:MULTISPECIES: flagellar assembly peptidoglycan hydrolase FlgJ [Halomonas]MCE8014785.1 flagellar assembly peptidoglycan hydrolase FlgJ [Halomonas sp. MCCC 1A17488]MCG3238118.1 flagellar assembly peptidoglycan hydrolase FlgJ [Halomonas sp. MCCC 1A17488]QPP48112.1 flagellar assembly peptidoglycan hydrolase FlgJ [Halomonas sp. SS10-MC5]QTP55401.1 flagellar assembly peptidoglycan hydrolase FlgJ [Halomonas sulfidoxydans]